MEKSLKGREKLTAIWKKQNGKCPICNNKIAYDDEWDIHHKIRKVDGGGDNINNLAMLHINCHRQIHSHDFKLK